MRDDPLWHCPKCGHINKAKDRVCGYCVELQNPPLLVPTTQEHDPHGKGAHEPGAKLDAGKLRPALVLGGFALALVEVTKVGTRGAEKYTDNGWEEVPDGAYRYTEAMLRHWLAEASGEDVDSGFGLLHAAHVAWNALARLELMLRKPR